MIRPLMLCAALLALGCSRREPPAPTPAPTQAKTQALTSAPEATDLDPAPGLVRVELVARRAADGTYRYNDSRPGPTIRAQVGDTLVVVLDNQLDAPTTIHWHGVDVPWAMDGVTWMRDPVAPGARFEYRFPLEHAGTFWYHPHFDTERQVDAGLYGLLVVEDPAEPAIEELTLVFDADGEHRPAVDDLPDGDPGRPAYGHAGRAAQWTVNGAPGPVRWTGRGGQSVRVRMVNAANGGYLALRWPGMRQIASDQGLLSEASTPDQVVLAPGDRAEFEWSIGQTGFTVERLPWSINGGRTWAEGEPLIEVDVEAPAPAPAPVAWPFAGGAPTPDPGHAALVYSFHGSDRSGVWLINGERFPDVTIEEITRGSRPVIEVRNVSASNHPFHLHGMRFEVLSVDGVAPNSKQIEDTVDIGIRERWRLMLMPEEPGDWMLHCHILPHADDGMMTVLRVR